MRLSHGSFRHSENKTCRAGCALLFCLKNTFVCMARLLRTMMKKQKNASMCHSHLPVACSGFANDHDDVQLSVKWLHCMEHTHNLFHNKTGYNAPFGFFALLLALLCVFLLSPCQIKLGYSISLYGCIYDGNGDLECDPKKYLFMHFEQIWLNFLCNVLVKQNRE